MRTFVSLYQRKTFDRRFIVKENIPTGAGRRGLLRALVTGTAAAAVARAVGGEADAAGPNTRDEKRRARYRPDSAEVQDFYRVNSYPPRSGRSSC